MFNLDVNIIAKKSMDGQTEKLILLNEILEWLCANIIFGNKKNILFISKNTSPVWVRVPNSYCLYVNQIQLSIHILNIYFIDWFFSPHRYMVIIKISEQINVIYYRNWIYVEFSIIISLHVSNICLDLQHYIKQKYMFIYRN